MNRKNNYYFVNKFYNIAKYELFKIPRSITGNGTLKTLKIIKKNISSFKIKFFTSKSKVFDWIVPPEWNITDAYVKDKNGLKIIDFKKNNLHIVGYSYPINKIISKSELLKRIHTHKKNKYAIPYVTSYYKKYWGFCCSGITKNIIKNEYNHNDKFEVKVKSNFNKNGKMYYGELFLKGKSKKEILISTYICHPSMANNELSGPIVSMCLINQLKKMKLNKSIRFIFIPETIGSIAYIHKNFYKLKKNTYGGINLSCLGDESKFSYIPSKYGSSIIDNICLETLKKTKIGYKKYSFLDRGSDERQFNSPGVDLPFVTICRSKFGNYKEYHTSFDDFNLVTKKAIYQSVGLLKKVILNFDRIIIPESKIICEPQLGKRKLYPTISNNEGKIFSKKILSFLQYSDGTNTLKQISRFIKLNSKNIKKIYKLLKQYKLIK